MLPVIALSVAIYAVTAAALLWLAHRFVRPFRRGVALVIGLTPLLFTGRATLTGAIYAPLDIVYDAQPFQAIRGAMAIGPDRTRLLGDVVFQEIPWRKAVRAAVARRELPLWNPHVFAGEPLLAVQQPAVFHPGTWMGFFLPLAQAWTYEMSLRILLALLCGYLFFRDLGCRNVPALIGASGWAFSNYLVFFLGYPLTPAAAPFPLLLLGLRGLARDPGRRPTAQVVVALLLIVTSGHPETLLHAVAAAGPYFLFELARARRESAGRAAAHAVLAGSLALGLSAVLLLPLAEALPRTLEHSVRTGWYAHQPRSRPWRTVAERVAVQVSPLAVAPDLQPRPEEAALGATAYAGALLFPLAIAGLFGRNRAGWFFAGLGILTLAVAAATPAADLLARLPLFDIALNERLIFVTGFSVCALAALGAERLFEGEGLGMFLAGSAATLGALITIASRYAPAMTDLGIPPGQARERLLIQVVPVVAGVVFVVFSRRRQAGTALTVLLLLLLAERKLEAGSLYPTIASKAFYPPLPILDPIPRGEPYRFAALRFSFIPNVAALYGLEDVRGYEAMTFRPLWETLPLWSVHQPVWYNRVDDPTTPFLSFLNVRWVLSPAEVPVPPGWKLLGESDALRLEENPRVLPRAFAPRLLASEPDPARRLALMKSIDDFAERGVVGEGGAPGWASNGEAVVAVAEYGASGIALDVDAKAPAVVGTSVTAWPGWKAKLDGRPVGSVSYNHAFLGFRVPPGRHRLALRYAPDSFRIGAAVSTASLVLALGLLFRPRRLSDPEGSARRPGANASGDAFARS